jgi:hypothetical protein
METSPLPPGQITGGAPFYSKPEPLNLEQHGKLGLRAVENPWTFASKQHFVPLLATEFAPAALSYPIIFAGDEPTPLAVMGLNEGENLYYDNEVLRADVYIPAYMRRYPFITAAEDNGERVVVCIDRDSFLIGEGAETPFFANGELTQYSKDCIDFCQNFEADRTRTLQMVKRLKELDLFEPREVNFQPPPAKPGETPPPPQRIAAFTAVSEAKLNALPVDTYIELRNSGYVQAIYAHLMSLQNWDRLIAVSLRRRHEENLAAQKKN